MDVLFLILKQTFIALIFILVFSGWGRILFKKFNMAFSSVFEEFFFASVAGISVVIIYVMALSMTGIAYKPLLILPVVGLMGLRGFKPDKNSLKWFGYLFLMTFPALLLSLYPPVHADSIAYHLPISQFIIDNHKLEVFSCLRYPVFPFNGEMLISLGLLFNEITSQLVLWVVLFVLTVGCFSEVEKKYAKFGGFIAAILLLSNQLLTLLGSIAYIDLILALFVTAGIIALNNYFKTDKKSWFYLSALIIGIAAGTKYSALIFCVVIGVVFIFKKRWKELFQYAILVGIVCSPWYIRNFYYSGNPIWPFMSDVFGYGNIWNKADYVGQFMNFQSGSPKDLISFIKLPLYLAHSTDGGAIVLNPAVWLGYFAGLFYFLKKKNSEWIFALTVTVFTLFWFLSVNLVRYYAPNIPLLVIFSALGFMSFFEDFKNRITGKTIIILLVISSLVLAYCFPFRKIYKRGIIPANHRDRYAYLTKNLHIYDAAMFAAGLPDDTYCLYNENMAFYTKNRIMGDDFGKARYSDTVKLIKAPDLLHRHLKELKAGFFMINRYRINDENISPELLKNVKLNDLFIKEYEDQNAVIYRLK